MVASSATILRVVAMVSIQTAQKASWNCHPHSTGLSSVVVKVPRLNKIAETIPTGDRFMLMHSASHGGAARGGINGYVATATESTEKLILFLSPPCQLPITVLTS